MRTNYNTRQKEIIVNYIKNLDKDFTVKDIYNQNSFVGLTTIYRIISKMYDEGLLNKTVLGNSTYYQYLEKCSNDNHFYLKCNKCGILIHIDCECIEKLNNHILKTHEFTLDKEKIIMSGICKECRVL